MSSDSHPTGLLRVLVLSLVGLGGCAQDAPETEFSPARSRPAALPRATPAPTPTPTPGLALARAGRWLARFPVDRMRFDAAVGLVEITRLHPSADLERTRERALTRAARDTDNPLQRFWDESYRADKAAVHDWEWAGGPRVNPNRVLIEALHCSEHGWRDETERYASGPMRDAGGYHSTHALWALVIADRNRCRTAFGLHVIADLADEMDSAQATAAAPATAREIDLYAERTLMHMLATAEPTMVVRPWIQTLIDLQHEDGSWGSPDPSNDYMQFHATMTASWAIARWLGSASTAAGTGPS